MSTANQRRIRHQISKLDERDHSINIPNPSEPSCGLSSAPNSEGKCIAVSVRERRR
jgi:hypothetical protein